METFEYSMALPRLLGHLGAGANERVLVPKQRLVHERGKGPAKVQLMSQGFLGGGSKIGLQSQVLFSPQLSMVENDIMSCPRRAAKTEDSATMVPLPPQFPVMPRQVLTSL